MLFLSHFAPTINGVAFFCVVVTLIVSSNGLGIDFPKIIIIYNLDIKIKYFLILFKMSNLNIINEEKNEDNIIIKNEKESSFERLCKLQKLIKEESMLKELCM